MWLYVSLLGLAILGGWLLLRSQYRQGVADSKVAMSEQQVKELVNEVKKQNTHLTDDDVANGLRLWAERLNKG